MAFVPVPDTAQAEIRMSLFGQAIENVLHFVVTGGWNPILLASLAATLADWWISEYSDFTTTDLTLREIYVKDIAVEGGAEVTDISAAGETGSIITQTAPSNCCACVSFRTGQSGRSYRGRSYISGIPISYVLENVLDSAAAIDIIDSYNTLAANLSAIDMQHVVVSRYNAGAPRLEGVATPVTTYLFADLDIDSQRRRLNGRGA